MNKEILKLNVIGGTELDHGELGQKKKKKKVEKLVKYN